MQFTRKSLSAIFTVLGALALAFAAHCGNDACIRNSDCASNETCTLEHCAITESDSGTNEAGLADTSTFDSGDSGSTLDSALVDAADSGDADTTDAAVDGSSDADATP